MQSTFTENSSHLWKLDSTVAVCLSTDLGLASLTICGENKFKKIEWKADEVADVVWLICNDKWVSYDKGGNNCCQQHLKAQMQTFKKNGVTLW